MSRRSFPARRTAIAAALLSLFAGGTVFAQDDESAPAETAPAPAAPADAEPAQTAPATTAEEPKPAEAARAAAVAAIGLERLSGEAFPSPQTRGIQGGSLRSTMHRLQWPYMPAVPGEPG